MVETKKFYLTKKGLDKIKKEYDFLKKLRMSKTTGEAPKILESEDLNPEYLSFQEDLNLLDVRLEKLANILKNAVLIEIAKKEKDKIVSIGTKITVEINGEEKDEFTIVGTFESNPVLGKISNESPVGQALLGHKVGDEVVISSPIKTVYKIKKIEYLRERS